MQQSLTKLTLQDREITLIGTAHVSRESVEEVTAVIREEKPDCVAIELDEERLKSLNDPEAWRKMDIIKVLREKKGFLLLANLVLAGFQRKMGVNVGVKPGEEMKAAYDCAKAEGIPATMVDRPVQVTLRRAWACNSLWGKCKLLATLCATAFDKSEVNAEEIENLKNRSEMDSMMSEISGFMPAVKEVLIDERDQYLASHIWDSPGKRVIAVLGAGHLPGVEKHLQLLAQGKESSDTTGISSVPPKGVWGKILGWSIPVLIIALIAAGFYFGGKSAGSKMALDWILWNGSLAALGAAVAAAHPLVILAAFAGAPLTSLCPLVGVGFLTGILQALLCKPKVSDMETLQDDITSVKGFYKNRILRVLLVFFLSSLGSSAGTFIAGASFVGKIYDFVKNLIG